MKGIIFNLLEEVVSTQLGEDAWDAILDSAGVEGAFYRNLEHRFRRLGRAAVRPAADSRRKPNPAGLDGKCEPILRVVRVTK